VLFGKLTWTRYGGSFIPQALSARELIILNTVLGCANLTKIALYIFPDVNGWQNHKIDVYASLLIPVTYTMFANGKKSAHPEDAPWPAALLGASSAYTLQGFANVGSLVDTGTLTGDESIEVSALCVDTPDVYIARPIQFKKFSTSDDPAILPTPFAKLPAIVAKTPDYKKVTATMSDSVVPVVRVDGRQMEERMVARVKQFADMWYRDDGDLMALGIIAPVFLLRSPFEEGKTIFQPAGSKWTVEGLGAAQGGKLDYLYVELTEPDPELVSYQLSQMGVKPDANTVKNLSVNSDPRGEMSMTQEEAMGIPHRLGGTRFE
jgi:hypothetical protein